MRIAGRFVLQRLESLCSVQNLDSSWQIPQLIRCISQGQDSAASVTSDHRGMTYNTVASTAALTRYNTCMCAFTIAVGSWLLIDFGLVRRYADDSGSHLPQRPDASFRGSTAYASVHAHQGEDLSRRDDLWSWLYMMAELLDGERNTYILSRALVMDQQIRPQSRQSDVSHA